MTNGTMEQHGTTETVSPHVRAATVLERSVCLTLACHYLGNTRKVEVKDLIGRETLVAIDDDAMSSERLDEKQFGAVKRLVDPVVLRPVMRILFNAKSYLKSTAIPTPRVFGERSYLIALPMLSEVDARLHQFADAIRTEAAILAAGYADAKEKAREALGPHFDETQYPDAETVRQAFSIEWDYISFAAPDRIETVDSVLYTRTLAKYEQRMSDAYGEVRATLRGVFQQIAQDLVDRLTPGPDGKRKVLRGTALDDLRDYLQTFSFRNITDDDDLASVVGKLEALAAGADVAQLKTDDGLRERVRTQAARAVAELDVLTMRRERAMNLNDV